MVIREEEAVEALRLFLAGKSKAEIGRMIGRDKQQVGKLLSWAMANKGERQ